MNMIQKILLAVSVIALLEAVWMLAAPGGYKACWRFWLRWSERLPTLLPIAWGLAGLAVWAVVLVAQPLYLSLTTLAGALLVLAAFLHARPARLNRFADRLILKRSPLALRLIAIAVLVAAGFCLWIAIKGQ